jgi:hypothetical protein
MKCVSTRKPNAWELLLELEPTDHLKPTNQSQFIIYQTEDQQTKLDVRFEGETVWLTQKLMADLFETSSDNIGLHLKNIYAEGELDEEATTEDYSVVRQEGLRQVKRKLKRESPSSFE